MSAWRVLLLLGALCALVAVVSATSVRAIRGLALLGLLSVFFAYLVAPLSRALREGVRKRGRRLSPPAALIVVYAAVGLLVLAGWLLMGARLQRQMATFSEVVPRQVTTALLDTSTPSRWRRFLGISENPKTALGSAGIVLSDWTRVHVADVLLDAFEQRWVLPWLAVVPVLSLILLTQFPHFRRSTLRVLPEGHLRWRGDEFLIHVNTVLAGYTRAAVLSGLFTAGACTIGFSILGVPYALLVALAAGVLELFPLVGPVTTALLLVSLVRGETLVAGLVFLVALRIVQDTTVYPRLIGRRMHLPGVAVLAAAWTGAWLGGIVGVLAAIPFVGVAAVAYRHWRDYRAIERIVREHERAAAAVAPPPVAGQESTAPDSQ